MQVHLATQFTRAPAQQWLRQGSRHLACVLGAPRRAALHPSRWLRSASASSSSADGEAQQPPAPLRSGEVHLFWLTPADVMVCPLLLLACSSEPLRLLALALTSQAHSPSLLDTYRLVLSPAELAHVDAAGAAADVCTERLLSRSLARLVLARYCRQPAQVSFSRPAVAFRPHTHLTLTSRCQALRLRSNAHGKPFVEGHPGVHFSVAHAPGALLCAVSCDGDVGVDVELQGRTQGRSASSLARLAARYFSAEEQAQLAAQPDEAAQRARFLELWTLKEAYVKALGRGIAAAPLSGFSVSLAPDLSAAQQHVRRIHLAHGAHASPDMYTRASTHAEVDRHAPVCSWHFQLLRLLHADQATGPHVAAVCSPCAALDAAPVLRCWRVLPTVRDVAVEPGAPADGGTPLQLLAQGLAPVRQHGDGGAA